MTTRRTFLKQTGLLTSAILLNPPFLFNRKYKLGIQLYTIRDAMAKDVRNTLRQVASFGYEEVETYGFNYGSNKNYWGYAPKQLYFRCNAMRRAKCTICKKDTSQCH